MKDLTNIEAQVDGDVLTLTIDLSKTHGPSKSGKTTIVATTHGNIEVEGTGVTLGVNAFRK